MAKLAWRLVSCAGEDNRATRENPRPDHVALAPDVGTGDIRIIWQRNLRENTLMI